MGKIDEGEKYMAMGDREQRVEERATRARHVNSLNNGCSN